MDDPGTDIREGRLAGLLTEAKAAVAYASNSLRAIRERLRDTGLDQSAAWERLRDALSEADRRGPRARSRGAERGAPLAALAAVAAEAGADDARLRSLRRDEALAGRELGATRTAVARVDLAIRSLETAWLFLGRDDTTLVADPDQPASAAEGQMRIVEAQEAERQRLAREVHDGPAQALSNAVFQVEVVERSLDLDADLARAELRLLRELLRRELADVRAFISQLRPPLLADLGLAGALRDAADQLEAALGVKVDVVVEPGLDGLPESHQTVLLRIVQEALQNVRKHAAPRRVAVVATRDGDDWLVEVRDDGRGFDVGSVAVRGRRNFGLQFMRERAELIGARFEVRSRPDGGTVVRLALPTTAQEAR
jgi:signal transduction histidine kinase